MKKPSIDVLNAKQSNVQNRSQKSRSVAQVDFRECKPMSKEEHIELVIERINDMRIDLTDDNDDYSSILYAFANDLGESGRKYVHQICKNWVGKNGQRYDYDDVDKAYDYRLAHGNGTSTIATFMAIAKDNGVDISMPPGRYPEGSTPPVYAGKPQSAAKPEKKQKDDRPAMTQVADFMLDKYSFRYNTVTNATEVLECGSSEWKRMDDRMFKTIYARIKKAGIRTNQGDVEALITSEDQSTSYNPIRAYFDQLPKWDPETGPDAITDFFSHVIVADEDRDFYQRYTRKWFLCFVALMLGKITENQMMLVLLGGQNVGKTYFCSHILPPQLLAYFHTILPGDKFDKDQLIAMSQFVLILFDEFKIDNKTSNLIKAIISSGESNVRAAYDRFARKRKRLASFIATGNDQVYISDAAGDRRYITVNAVAFRRTEEHPLPYDMAYAQALYLINQPDFVSHLSRQEVDEIAKRNEEHVEPDLCEGLILKYFRKPNVNEKGIMVSNVDIIEKISILHRNSAITPTNVGKAMGRLKFDKRNHHGRARYYVIPLTQADNDKEAEIEGEIVYVQKQKEAIDAAQPEDLIPI